MLDSLFWLLGCLPMLSGLVILWLEVRKQERGKEESR
jgi:hypothetical protein